MRKKTLVLLVLPLLLASCGPDSAPQTPQSEESLVDATPTAPAGDGGDAPSRGPGRDGGSRASGDGDGDRGSRPDKTGEVAGGGGASGGPSGDGNGAGRSGVPRRETDVDEEKDAEAGGGGRLAPRAGKYVYAQDGFEEFCAAACDRRELPPRQTVSTSVLRRGDAATVVTEARSSNGGMTRASARYTRSSATVTEVYVRFSYSGYTFDRTYRPRPPVETLRFPLRPGAEWSGRWRGKVSGAYSVSVAGRETVSAAGNRVPAVKITTRTTFSGDFSGRANTTTWVDPRTRGVVRTAGNLDVRSSYGSYRSAFATSLARGPGY